MNTKKRCKINADIVDSVAKKWRENLQKCFDENGYNVETFVAVYKARYDSGNPTDVRRWLNAGLPSSKGKIGLPSYDTMKRLADFFGVTVGYLTGETDYKTFDMERACAYFGIDEDTGAAIREITKGRTLLQTEDTAAFCYLVKAEHFRQYVRALSQLATDIDRQKKPIHHLEETWKRIDSQIRDLAMEWRDYNPEIDGEAENVPEWTPELLSAMKDLNEAERKDYAQPYKLDRAVKVSKYDLYELNIKLIDDVLNDAHLKELVGCQNMSPEEFQEYFEEITHGR